MRVCANPECPHGGTPQPLTNFYTQKYRCKTCVKLAEPERRRRDQEKRRQRTAPADFEQAGYLPIGPWRDWLLAELKHESMLDLARRIGVTERRLYEWVYRSKSIQLDTLDRALCEFRRPWLLRDLYPALFDECDECGGVGVHFEGCEHPNAWQKVIRKRRRRSEAA